MSREIIIRPEAEAEMAEAYDWYENCIPRLGSEFLLSIEAVLLAIERTPQQYPLIHKGVRRALTRRFPYQFFFIDEKSRLVVLAVFHARRNLKDW